MKKTAALLLTLALLLTALTAFTEGELPAGDDPVALTVNSHEITKSELKSAAVLYMFESALQCAGYGYGFDMTDRLNIEDEMDKLVFDMELWYTAQDLAEEMGLYPLSEEAGAAAAANAEETWEYYRGIAWSDNGMAFLPAGDYQNIEGDPEGNITRYFASFGLTKEALLEKAVLDQADEELEKTVTAFMADRSEDEIIDYYTDWFLERMDEQYILTDDEVIGRVIEELAGDSSENPAGAEAEADERSLVISGCRYILGESTIRDFERNGWAWTQTADGKFAFRVTEDGNEFYAETEDSQPDGKLILVDLFYAYEISYEYLGFGFDLAFDPDAETDIYTYLEEYYEADYTDDGILQARTEVGGGTLLIEIGEGALRLTLE